eukprot:TRINITY_DN8407_c0_g1_i1.p1 TRINITY_DN8407_c0_g1~~TRINITY_DN8407_c0_g1_i1.p1  ORF type:complete len:161 (-),score=27.20 TRINITY_DN8407_c0_g1_i1:347-829(-)
MPRDPLDVSDIEGTSARTPRKLSKPRDPLFTGDIEGSSAKQPRERRKCYNTLDYSDVQEEYKKNPSISVTRTIRHKGELVMDREPDEVHEYKDIAKNEMRIVRAIGPSAATVLREVKHIKASARKFSNPTTAKKHKAKCHTERQIPNSGSRLPKKDINSL